ncbi:MAG: hypothetical protein NZ703_11685, partial [Gemmataceae bacterium]|nr:hypothetical protein [Gemmataceae bacterium]
MRKAVVVGRVGGWLTFALIGMLAGCKWCHKVPLPTIRGQMPEPRHTQDDPGQTAYRSSLSAEQNPTSSGVPPSDGLPIVTAPSPAVTTRPSAPSTSPVEHSTDSVQPAGWQTTTAAIRLNDLLQQAVPRIKIVALVGSQTVITDQEVREAVYQRLGEYRHLPGPLRVAKQNELYAAELRRIIERELLLADMHNRLKKAGKLSVLEEIREHAEKTADRALYQIRKGYGAETEEDFLSILRAQGLTLQVVRRQLVRQIMADEYARTLLKDRVRTPAFTDIRAYYESHSEEFRTEDAVKWQHLFLSFARFPSQSAACQLAEQIRQQALQGADFAALVKQHDQGLAAGNGGWGIGHKRGEIQPPD